MLNPDLFVLKSHRKELLSTSPFGERYARVPKISPRSTPLKLILKNKQFTRYLLNLLLLKRYMEEEIDYIRFVALNVTKSIEKRTPFCRSQKSYILLCLSSLVGSTDFTRDPRDTHPSAQISDAERVSSNAQHLSPTFVRRLAAALYGASPFRRLNVKRTIVQTSAERPLLPLRRDLRITDHRVARGRRSISTRLQFTTERVKQLDRTVVLLGFLPGQYQRVRERESEASVTRRTREISRSWSR